MSYLNRKKTRYFAWVVPIPYGTVEGRLNYEGRTWNVTGTGYHDHNWGKRGPGDGHGLLVLGKGAHRGVQHDLRPDHDRKGPGNRQPQATDLLPDKGRRDTDRDDGLPLSLVTRDFVKGSGGRTYPTKLDFHWENEEGKVHLAIAEPSLIESIDILESFPRWERPLIHLFASSYYYDFNADLELIADLKGVEASEKGRALYELMMLR